MSIQGFRNLPPLLTIGGTVGIAVAILAASVFVWHRLPYATDVQAPFDVHGSAGSPVSGRLFSVTVIKAAVAPVVKHTGALPKNRNLTASGQWVVVTATVTSLLDAPSARVALELDGNAYTPDDRLDLSTLGGAILNPLIPQTGVYVFEAPTELVNRVSVGRLYVSTGTNKWDTGLIIDVPLDPGHAPRSAVLALAKTKVGTP